MIGSILQALGNLLNATSNRVEIEHLRDAIRRLEANKKHTQETQHELRATLHDHEKRLIYLELWKESQGSSHDSRRGSGDGWKSSQPRRSLHGRNRASQRYHPPMPRTREQPDRADGLTGPIPQKGIRWSVPHSN